MVTLGLCLMLKYLVESRRKSEREPARLFSFQHYTYYKRETHKISAQSAIPFSTLKIGILTWPGMDVKGGVPEIPAASLSSARNSPHIPI